MGQPHIFKLQFGNGCKKASLWQTKIKNAIENFVIILFYQF
jgi:hypothetical protein